jgi:hypothetical protein
VRILLILAGVAAACFALFIFLLWGGLDRIRATLAVAQRGRQADEAHESEEVRCQLPRGWQLDRSAVRPQSPTEPLRLTATLGRYASVSGITQSARAVILLTAAVEPAQVELTATDDIYSPAERERLARQIAASVERREPNIQAAFAHIAQMEQKRAEFTETNRRALLTWLGLKEWPAPATMVVAARGELLYNYDATGRNYLLFVPLGAVAEPRRMIASEPHRELVMTYATDQGRCDGLEVRPVPNVPAYIDGFPASFKAQLCEASPMLWKKVISRLDDDPTETAAWVADTNRLRELGAAQLLRPAP